MAEEEFRLFRAALLQAYADELCEATGVTTEEAEAMADAHLEVPPEEYHAAVRIRDASTDEDVGVAWMLIADGDAFLMEFRIDAAHRGRGFGGAAMAELEGLARRGGANQIRLHVFARNAPARALYERHGFETVSLQMRKRLDSDG